MARSENRTYDQAEAKPSRCRKCSSTNRSAYFGEPEIKLFDFVQTRPDGSEFTRLTRRRTKCEDCGQFRFDLSYDFLPDDVPTAAVPTKTPAAKKPPTKKAPTPAKSAPSFLGAAQQE